MSGQLRNHKSIFNEDNRILYDNMMEAVVIVDDFGIIRYVNEVFYSIFECCERNTIGYALDDFIIECDFKKIENIETNIYTISGKNKMGHDIYFSYKEVVIQKNIVYFISDVTQYNITLKNLNQITQLKNAILETLPTFFVKINPNGTIRYINTYMQHSIGVTHKEAYNLDYISNFVMKEDMEKVKEVFKEIRSNKRKYYINQNRIRCKNGSIKMVEWYSCSIMNEKNEVDYFFGIGMDITEKNKLMEELTNRLQDAEVLSANLRSVLNYSQDFIWAVDPEYKIQVCNEAFKQHILTNYGKKICINSNLSETIPEKGIVIWEQIFHKVIDQGALNMEYHTINGNKYLNLYITPIYKKGTLISISIYANDITELKLTELELKKSEERLKEAQRISKTGHWEFDLSTNNFKLSEEMYRIFEINKKALNISYKTLLSMIHPEDKINYWILLKQFIKSRKECTLEFRIITGSGTVKYIKQNYYYEFDNYNTPIFYMGTLQDITEQKRIEDSIYQLNKVLEVKVAERTYELIKVNKCLEEVNKGLENEIEERLKLEKELKEAKFTAERSSQYKSEFLANMSHEIRTPLNAIIGFYHLLKNTKLQPKQEDYVEKAEISAQNLLCIINDILDFSKIEANKVELEYTNFSIRKLLVNIDSIIKPYALEKNINFSIIIDGDVPQVLIGDPIRISQIIMNLANNAVKFTLIGDVSVKVSVKEKNSYKVGLLISVSDNGIGMSKEQIEVIFNLFTQGDSSISRKFGGTGLGLSICKSLADLMGGSITVESTLNEGSTFNFQVTLEYSECIVYKDSLINKELKRLQFFDTNVLLVEDNKMNQQVSYEIMKYAGINVDTADNGTEALQLLSKGYDYDVILLDLYMPIMNGYDTAKQIRSLNLSIPIIAVTANISNDLRSKIIDSGMDDFISKPFEPLKLLTMIKSMIAGEKVIEIASFNPNIKNLQNSIDDAKPVNLLPDLPGLDTIKAMTRLYRNKELYFNLLQYFLENNKDIISVIENKVSVGDKEEAIRFVHSLKGSAANIGASHLSIIADKIQTSLEQVFPYENFKDDIVNLENEMRVVVSSIKLLIKYKVPIKSLKSYDNSFKIHEEISTLSTLINMCDYDAISQFNKIKDQLEEHFDILETNRLYNMLVKFHWEDASMLLKELLNNNSFHQ